ncbi:MAG: c-type cytochrome biogenesis protein CcmI [Paracoccaceae bacterium]|nr:c-type cytochrome biogenesis protein CcmI [Paracoccaceae bacterium]
MGNWQFWIAAGGMIVAVAALMILALRGKRGVDPTAAHDLQVYRDQLKDVDRDLARGTITEEDAGRLRAEVGRRVLEADRALSAETAAGPARAPRAVTRAAILGIVAVLAGSVWLYDRIGAPGYPDLPVAERLALAKKARDSRISQTEAEAKMPKAPAPKADPKLVDLIAKLRTAVAKRPDDLTGQQLLARNEAELGNYDVAWRAQEKVVALEGDKATAQDYAVQAGLMILAAGGYVSPQADKPLSIALKLDPNNGTARYYTGLMFAQTGRPDLTFQLWEPLLEKGPQNAPWVAPIRAQIEAVAQAAGINFQLPPAADQPGPDAGAMAAAAQMSPAQRQQMIRGMVEGLASRLDAKGGSAAEWARLIRAYGVLGEGDKQKAALAKAEAAYASSPNDLAEIRAAMAAPAAPALKGPTAEQMQAAGQMSATDRQAMIEGMVSRLADKLKTQGGTAAEWAQLIKAYGVLGQTDNARAMWQKAQEAFGGNATALAPVREAAVAAGVAK